MRAWSDVVAGKPDCRLVVELDERYLAAALKRLRSRELDGLTFVPGGDGGCFIDDRHAEQLAANQAALARGDYSGTKNIYVCTTVQFAPGKVTFEQNYTEAGAMEAETQILAELVADPDAVRDWAFYSGGPDYGWEVAAEGVGGEALLALIA